MHNVFIWSIQGDFSFFFVLIETRWMTIGRLEPPSSVRDAAIFPRRLSKCAAAPAVEEHWGGALGRRGCTADVNSFSRFSYCYVSISLGAETRLKATGLTLCLQSPAEILPFSFPLTSFVSSNIRNRRNKVIIFPRYGLPQKVKPKKKKKKPSWEPSVTSHLWLSQVSFFSQRELKL